MPEETPESQADPNNWRRFGLVRRDVEAALSRMHEGDGKLSEWQLQALLWAKTGLSTAEMSEKDRLPYRKGYPNHGDPFEDMVNYIGLSRLMAPGSRWRKAVGDDMLSYAELLEEETEKQRALKTIAKNAALRKDGSVDARALVERANLKLIEFAPPEPDAGAARAQLAAIKARNEARARETATVPPVEVFFGEENAQGE